MTTNPFEEAWRQCLREHYLHVIRENDATTRQSLTRVLLSEAVGLTESDLRAWYIEATMHVDDVGEHALPDPDIVRADVRQAGFDVHPAECTCTLCSPVQEAIEATLEAGHDADGQPLPIEEDDDDDTTPTQRQMSLF